MENSQHCQEAGDGSGRIHEKLRTSPADLHAFVGGDISGQRGVPVSVLQLYREVGAYGHREDGPIAHHPIVADRLDLLGLDVVSTLPVELLPGVADDLPCLARETSWAMRFRCQTRRRVPTPSASTVYF